LKKTDFGRRDASVVGEIWKIGKIGIYGEGNEGEWEGKGRLLVVSEGRKKA
jgi:hypothetical protein